MSFLVLNNHLTEEERASCFILLLLLLACHVAISVLCLFLAVSWAGLWSVIVAFPGHTHLHFNHVPMKWGLKLSSERSMGFIYFHTLCMQAVNIGLDKQMF